MNRICVFCGSSPGARPEYLQAAEQLGHIMARRNIGLVYGGAKVGMMGKIADAVLEKGGEVIGIIPKGLVEKEVAHTGLSDLRIVKSMHERKAMMAELSDGFIAMPGGLGTIEELFEVLTWSQIGIHDKPCGLLNVEGYYEKLMDFVQHTVEEEFVKNVHQDMMLMYEDPEKILQAFETYKPPTFDKAQWVLEMSEI